MKISNVKVELTRQDYSELERFIKNKMEEHIEKIIETTKSERINKMIYDILLKKTNIILDSNRIVEDIRVRRILFSKDVIKELKEILK